MAVTFLGSLLAGVGIFLLVRSLDKKNAANADPLAARLSVYDQVLHEREIELQKPFAERVLAPLGERLKNYLGNRTPDKQRLKLNQDLALAGRPNGLSADDLIALRYGAAIALFVVGLLLGLLLHNQLFLALFALGGALGGYFGPQLWLKQKVDARRKQIGLALPDAMDLLTIAVEAGLGFDQALVRLTEKMKNALGDEFSQVLSEVRLGRPRLEALDDMGRRSGVDDLHNFVQAVIQSEQMGVGLSKILRIQSDEMRRRRRQRAQEKAAQATLKMMLPMVGCIFPTIWIVLLGPAILMIMNRPH
jgi:tight adherence protein C